MFISFEGPDGSGKSTVSKLVKEKLEKDGISLILTREPGGSKIAEQIRNVILDKENTALDARAEALLYAASRRQHLVETIIPALKEGKLVLCDRFVDSSLAYQGGGRNLGVDEVLNLNLFATENLFPNYTLFFNITPEEGIKRLSNDKQRVADRLDLESENFHDKVYDTFIELSKRFADRYIMIDATKPLDEVVNETYRIIKEKLNEN